jgi:transposase
MYHEIHKLSRNGFSNAKIAHYLVLDARTVKRMLSMTEEQYELQLLSAQSRTKILSPYEPFVLQKLETFHDTPAAQMHDWLKEHYPDLEKVSTRTVFNFVMYVRQKYNIPVVKIIRQYFPVEELYYGLQAQVDFGSYNMRIPNGGQKKIHFFAMVLSRSRMKYIWFIDKPFTSQSVCQAHENAFFFFNGIPKVIVYDQDRTLIVDENMGSIILTLIFKQYTRSRNFELHFCRKADPESKGKIENVIQFVKKNFLLNRPYLDLETLNTQALAWLARTANALEHNYTKKVPQAEFEKERPFLKPYTPMIIDNKEEKIYHVRKTNTIAHKSNFYSLPIGTYMGTGTQVNVKEKDGALEIYNAEQILICTHLLCTQKGQTIINNHHKRDISKTLQEMIEQTVACFANEKSAREYINNIKKKVPRYLRDHLQVLLKSLTETDVDATDADKALAFCINNSLFSGYDFTQVLYLFLDKKPVITKREIKLLDKNNLEKASQSPEKSNIEEYENIINQKKTNK